MKQFRILAIAAAALFTFGVSACTSPTVESTAVAKVGMTGSSILTAIQALPTSFKSDVAAVIAKFPTAATDLDAVANATESLATDAAAVPLPATLQNTIVGWVETVPGKIGAVATGVAAAYQVAYPALVKIPNALTAIGEFIRTFEPAKAAATTLSAAVNHGLQYAAHLSYAVLNRRQ